jgi:hypothetical protein
MFDDGRGEFVRVRYYPPEDVIMIRRDTTLKTVTELSKSESELFIRRVREQAREVLSERAHD